MHNFIGKLRETHKRADGLNFMVIICGPGDAAKLKEIFPEGKEPIVSYGGGANTQDWRVFLGVQKHCITCAGLSQFQEWQHTLVESPAFTRVARWITEDRLMLCSEPKTPEALARLGQDLKAQDDDAKFAAMTDKELRQTAAELGVTVVKNESRAMLILKVKEAKAAAAETVPA